MLVVGDLIKNSTEFEWKIPQFFSLSKESYKSTTFSFAGQSWYFAIFPNGYSGNDSIGYIGIYLYGVSSNNVKLESSISLKTSSGKKLKIRDCTFGNGAHKSISRSELTSRKLEFVPSDIFTIICTLKYAECIADESEPSTSGPSIVLKNKLQHDFKELFLSKEDCDVVIKVQSQDFPAHRNILKARSPVFASTFRNDMKEKATGVVDIEDCDPSSFSDFLCFLYCGDEGNISKENVFSLFTTSDKYQVEDLRTCCVEFMKENLSVATFCDTITLALKHSETELVKLSSDFFIKNAPKIIVTVKWQKFITENPIQSNELFIKLLVPENSLNK